MVPKADQNEATPAQESDDLIVNGCVCPQCYKHLRAPVVTDHPTDRYGPRTRSYAGMCFACRQACRVYQFEQDDKWLIHKHLVHRYESGTFIGIGDWIEVNPLPEPPAVLTGPGGDFDKPLDLSDDPVVHLLQSAFDMLAKTAKAFGELLAGLEKLRNTDGKKDEDG